MEDADHLLHAVDAPNPRFEQHIASVNSLLEKLGLDGKRRLLVFNKTDLLPRGLSTTLCRRFNAVPVCALDVASFTPLLGAIEEILWPRRLSQS